MPHSGDRTGDLRPSERAAGSGYPLGFAKSQWVLRDRLLIHMQRRAAALPAGAQEAAAAIHEAVARALDWERLLGSFNHAGEDRFPVSAIDQVARNVLAWLTYQGFVLHPTDPAPAESLPVVASRLPVVFDNARQIVVLVTAQEEPGDVAHERR
jgi:hypothetical protein